MSNTRLSSMTFQPYQTTSSTRKSLLDPSSFGFDAQNGDPRVIMAEKGNDVSPSPRVHQTDRYKRHSAVLDTADDESHIELITVPALGAEYTEQELKDLRRETKKGKSWQARRQSCATWLHSESKFCGCLSPRVLVFLAFFFFIGVAIMLYFVIPRVPLIAVNTVQPLTAIPNGASMITHHAPTNFSMDMNVNLRADNSDAWVPTKANEMILTVFDMSTSRRVGEGRLEDHTFPARTKSPFIFPVHFAYASINVTGDQTWAHWINACGPKYDNTPRQALSLQFTLTMKVQGRLGIKGTSVQLSDLECPFTLQPDQT